MFRPSTRVQQIIYWTATLGLVVGGSVVLALGAPAWTSIGIGLLLLGSAVTLMINLSILHSTPPRVSYSHIS